MSIVPYSSSAVGGDTSAAIVVPAVQTLSTNTHDVRAPDSSVYGSIVAGGSTTALDHASGNMTSLTNPVVAGSLGFRRMDQSMADTSFRDALHRAVLVAQYNTFTSSAAIGAFYPWTVWKANPFVSEKLANFNYITGSIIISGVLKGPPLASGLLCVSAYPSYEPTSSAQPTPRALCTVVEHVMVDMSTSSDFEITLPWVYSSNWGNLEDELFQRQWTISVDCLSPLRSAVPDGCAAATLNIYCRPGPDFRLSGATYQAGELSASTGRTPRRSGKTAATPIAPYSGPTGATAPQIIQDAAHVVESKTGYRPSQITSAGAWTAAALGAMAAPFFPPAGAALETAAGVLAVASRGLDYFGLTRSTKDPIVEEANLKPATNLISCDGDDTGRVSALFRSNGLSTDPSISGTLSSLDETATSFIYSRYTHIGKFTWESGNSANPDQIFPVTPCLFVEPEEDLIIPTTAGYVGSRFSYWRGDVEFLFYPVVSPALRGAIQFIWQPVPKSDAVAVDLTNLSVNSIVDVSAARPIEVKIGYNNDLPACQTDFYKLGSALDAEDDYETLNGYLRVRNIVPLTDSVCGQPIDIHVFARAGANMEFGRPTAAMSVEGETYQFGLEAERTVILQSGTIGVADQGIQSVQLVPSSGPYPVAEILWGECVRSVRALIQKPSAFEYSTVGVPYTTPYPEVYSQSNGDPRITGNLSPFRGFRGKNTFFSWFGTMFLGYAGSVRRKFIIDRESVDFVSDALPTGVDAPTDLLTVPMIVQGSSSHGVLPLGEVNPTVTDTTLTAEYTIPYYHSELYTPAYKDGPVLSCQAWSNPYLGGAVEYQFRAAEFISAGPDARLSFFRAQNAIRLSSVDPDLVHSPQYWWIFRILNGNGGETLERSAEVRVPERDIPFKRRRDRRDAKRRGETKTIPESINFGADNPRHG